MRRRAYTAAALILAGAMTVGGCSGPHSTPQRTGGSSPSPSLAGTSVPEMQRFASVKLPGDASGVRVTSQWSSLGTQRYWVRFDTTEAGADAFCSGNRLGGPLVAADGLDAATRKKYGVTGGSKKEPHTCSAEAIGASAVERDALITYPGSGKATVYLIAYEMPAR